MLTGNKIFTISDFLFSFSLFLFDTQFINILVKTSNQTLSVHVLYGTPN